MSSTIELEFISKNDDATERVSIFCAFSTISEENQIKLKKKCGLFTSQIQFVDPDDVSLLKKVLSPNAGFTILLVECHSFLKICVIRNSLNETVPIYTYCCHSPTTCEEEIYLRKIDVIKYDFDSLIDALIRNALQRRRERRLRDGLFISLFSKNQMDRSSMEINGKFVQYQLLMNCITEMKPSEIDRREFLSFFQRKFSKNPYSLKHVQELENYESSSCLKWYTRESFVYKELNKALRTQNIHLIFLFRFLIKDIKEELRRLQSHERRTLYRWQVMSSEELRCLKKHQGSFISMNSFLSTTLDRAKALKHLEGPDTDQAIKRILFEIDANPYENSEKPFANIIEQSDFPSEEEYLMMLGSIFRIDDVIESSEIIIIRMSLINENLSEYEHVYQHLKDQYNLKSSRYLSLGYVLIDMAQFHFSQFYLHRALEDVQTDFRVFPKCYQALGKVSFENGFYQLSLEYFHRSLDLATHFNPNDPLIAYLYNNIGEVYEKQGFYLKAFHSFHRALQIFKRLMPTNVEYFAWCYNNLGIIYQRWKNYDYALFFLEETLRIQSEILPKYHPCTGNTHNNLGNVYYSLGLFDQALESYRLAHQIFCSSLTHEHPSIARTARNIALVYENQENLHQAEKYYKHCERIRHQILPADHPDIIEINEDLHRTLNKLHQKNTDL